MAANRARPGSDGRPWPGYAVRICPVCRQRAGTHRASTNGQQMNVVVYQHHSDGIGNECLMSEKRAAIGAISFSAAEAGLLVRAGAA